MEPILGPILGPDRPKRGQDEPKRTIKSFKEPKNCIFTKVVCAWDSRHFFALRASQKRIKRPKKAPKRHPKNSKTPKQEPKIGPKNHKKLDQFWGNFGTQNDKPKKNKNGSIFGTPFPRISGIQIMPRQKKRKRGKKPTGTGIILSKRKGGIRPYKALIRPLQGLVRPYKAL